MTEFAARVIELLTFEQIMPLVEVSLADGYTIVHRLWQEYKTGENRFDSDGAALYGVYDGDTLIAVGGVHRDPYSNRDEVGRVRHVYVHPALRRSGIGRMLVSSIIDHSVEHFDVLTLRTPTDHGDKFYTSLGFRREPNYESATHWLSLRSDSTGSSRGRPLSGEMIIGTQKPQSDSFQFVTQVLLLPA